MSQNSASSPHSPSDADSGPSNTTAEHTEITHQDSPSTSPHSSDKPKARTSRACSSCNRQKLRCDGGKPCTRCLNNAISEGCEYLPSLRGKTRKRKIRPAPEPSTSPRKSVKRESPVPEVLEQPPVKRSNNLPAIFGSQLAYWKHDSTNARQIPLPGLRGLHRITEPRKDGETALDRIPGRLPSILSRLTEPSDRPSFVLDSLASFCEGARYSNPLAVLAEASTTSATSDPLRPRALDGHSIASTGPYDPTPEPRPSTPLASGILALISTQLAEQLFAVYFRILHPHYPFLDIHHCCPQAVYRRNEFLFNAICIVSARATDASLWRRLKTFALAEMSRLPREISIDTVQGHLVYAVWNPFTADSTTGDSTWTRVGLAVRTAVDVGLGRVVYDKDACSALPRWALRSITRTWLLACTLDQTLSTQLDRPCLVQDQSVDAYHQVLLETRQPPAIEDVWTVSLSEWSGLFSRAIHKLNAEIQDLHRDRSEPQGKTLHRIDLIRALEASLRQWQERAIIRTRESGADDRLMRIALSNIRLYENYTRLVFRSSGLQRAEEHLALDVAPAFAQFQAAWIRLITNFDADFDKTSTIHGLPDFHYKVLMYAAVSLSKTTEAKYAHLESHRPTIADMVKRAVDILSRGARSADHLPSSLAGFLDDLLSHKNGISPRGSGVTPKDVELQHFGVTLDSDPTYAIWPPTSGRDSVISAPGPEEDISRWREEADSRVPESALSLGVGTFGMRESARASPGHF